MDENVAAAKPPMGSDPPPLLLSKSSPKLPLVAFEENAVIAGILATYVSSSAFFDLK